MGHGTAHKQPGNSNFSLNDSNTPEYNTRHTTTLSIGRRGVWSTTRRGARFAIARCLSTESEHFFRVPKRSKLVVGVCRAPCAARHDKSVG